MVCKWNLRGGSDEYFKLVSCVVLCSSGCCVASCMLSLSLAF